ncbi:MAG TPA: hypothetical protein VHX16_12895 [Chloroflexota bacterium]|jgi:hypothetical protein|nr:hypothetical protein [Chloroflexota bacterium]
MSEYQYYEFVAIDRPLTPIQQQELREITSRATITSTRLVNEYHWGDFRGDPLDLIERYFDAHLYYANWGTRILMLGFPSNSVDVDALAAYADDEFVRITERADRVIVEMGVSETDSDWDEHAEPQLADLISLRADLMAGDMRALYLASLNGMGIWIDEIELDEEVDEEGNLEPPLPAGLATPNASLEALIEFLELDQDLVAAAAEASPPLPSTSLTDEAMERWLHLLPERDKDAYLKRIARGEINLSNELRLRFIKEQHAESSQPAPPPRRQVAALIGRAEKLRFERQTLEALRREAEEAQRREARARERSAHLDRLRGREQQLWGQAEALANTKRAHDYDRAITLLSDLRDLAQGGEGWTDFRQRLYAFRNAHEKKPALMQRLDRAGLR